MDENKNSKQQQVLLPMELAEGKYSNFQIVGHTPTEFIIDFCMLVGSPNPHVVSRIILNALQMKAFITVLQENLAKYENEMKITLPENAQIFIESGIIKNTDQG